MPTRISDPALSFQYGVFISSPIPITGYFTEISGLSEGRLRNRFSTTRPSWEENKGDLESR